MPFGDVRGFLFGGANSITNPISATGSSVTVAVGDLIVAVISQQTANTSTACGDNLTNTYTAQNAGSLATVSGRMWYSRATNAGTLTSVNFTTTASANDCAVVAAVYEGPFVVSPLDVTPANLTGDITTPYSCPASGTLAQAQEVIIGWFSAASSNAYVAGNGFAVTVQKSQSANAMAVIAALTVSATTTQTPIFTGTAPTASVLGTASFKRDPINATTAGAAGTSSLTAATGRATAAIQVTAGGAGVATAEGASIAPPRILVSFVEIEGVEADAVASSTGAGAAAGQGAAAATGTAIISDAVSATATSTAQATGASFVARTATAAGTSTATAATGQAIRYQTVTAAGAGATTATGLAIFAAAGQAAGIGTAAAVGIQVGTNVGIATGLGAATATGTAITARNAVAAGVGATTATSAVAAVISATASATASSTATATGQRIVFNAAVANATATSTAQATGRAIVAGAANAVGAGAATATSRATVASVGNAAGLGSAQAGGQWITGAVAFAAGIGQAQATGFISTGNIKTQYLTGRRSQQLTVIGTKVRPEIIAQRKAPATWIAQQ